jgi:hypothetical protein
VASNTIERNCFKRYKLQRHTHAAIFDCIAGRESLHGSMSLATGELIRETIGRLSMLKRCGRKNTAPLLPMLRALRRMHDRARRTVRRKTKAASQILVIALTAVVVILSTAPARADWYYPLVRITCIPQASYAAVETFGLYNIGTSLGAVPKELSAQGIYKLSSLADKPVICDLPKGKLLIEVLNYHAPRDKGECGGNEDADLRVSLAGTQLVLVKGTHGGCNGSQRHDIQISEYELHHCVLQFKYTQGVAPGGPIAVPTMCENVPLP